MYGRCSDTEMGMGSADISLEESYEAQISPMRRRTKQAKGPDRGTRAVNGTEQFVVVGQIIAVLEQRVVDDEQTRSQDGTCI